MTIGQHIILEGDTVETMDVLVPEINEIPEVADDE